MPAWPRRDGRDLERARSRDRRILHLRHLLLHGRRLGGVEPRDEDILPRARQLLGDERDLFDGLRLSEDDLGRARAQRAVMIDGREAEISKRKVAQLGQRLLDRRAARAHAFEQGSDARRVHDFTHLPHAGASVDLDCAGPST